MGAWGDESCSNDGCWDLLDGFNNIHEIKQEEVEAGLERALDEGRHFELFERLGCIIWVLRQGLKVPKEILEKAKDWPDKCLADEGSMCDWRSRKSREKQLLKERKNILDALAGDGSINQEHVEGLFEKMGKMMGGERG